MSRAVRIATAIWAASIFASRIIGIVREAVIGRTLGASADADAYAAAFVIPDFLNYLLAGGVLSIVFIPIFEGYMSRGEEDRGWDAFSAIANVLVIALSLVTVLLWWATPHLTPLVAAGFSPENQARLTELTRIILPAQVFIFVGGLLSAVLQARDRHGLPALAPLLYSGSITVMGLVLGPRMGAEGFAWGVLVGAVLGPFGLPLYGCLKAGLRWRPILSLRHPDVRRYLWLSLPIMLAFSVVVLDEWVLKRLGSLLGEGVVAQLQYARQIMRVPMGVFGMATGVAAYPTVSRLVGAGALKEAYATLVDATRLLLTLALTAQAALMVAGTEVATVIYGTRRMSAADLASVGDLTALMCLALGAWSAQTVLSRGFYAQGRTWVPSVLGSGVMVAAYPLYVVLGDRFGAPGLTLASSAAILVYTFALGILLKRSMAADGEGVPALADVLWKMGVAVSVGVGVGEGAMRLPGVSDLPALLAGAWGGGAAVLVTLGTARALGLAEVTRLTTRLSGAIRRRLPATLRR